MRMILSVILILTFLVGCSTTPIKRNFPDAPKELLQKCEKLELISNDKIVITDMMKVIIRNYQLHYECENKLESWQEWYTNQRKIFEQVK
jgi:PBP1b-binding outer membrane lipoprotein LpoB